MIPWLDLFSHLISCRSLFLVITTQNVVKEFFSIPKNFFWLLSRTFMGVVYSSLLVWFPYYYSSIGFENESSTISIMYPIATTLGTIIVGSLAQKFTCFPELFISGLYIVKFRSYCEFFCDKAVKREHSSIYSSDRSIRLPCGLWFFLYKYIRSD